MATQAADVQDDATLANNDTSAEHQDAPQLSEVEELASEMGWKPETDYSGPKDKWKPAKDWLKAGDAISKELKHTVKGLKDTVDRMAAAGSKQTERALREEAKRIEANFAAAVANKDTGAAAAAAKEMRDLEAGAAEPNTSAEDAFARENPWYGANSEATAFAVATSQAAARAGKSIPDQLAAVTDAMKRRFPELYGEQRTEPKPQPGVNAPTTRAATPRRDKGFADLPQEVKRAAESYAKLFQERHGLDPEKSKAQYAKDYYANQAA